MSTMPMAGGAPRTERGTSLRDQLSSLQGLLVLSMLMTESGDEGHILELAASSVPSLGPYRLHGVHMTDGGWRAVGGREVSEQVRMDLEAQFAVVSSAGGAVGIVEEGWGWAFPLRSLEGHFGHMVIGADADPSAEGQFLLRVLAQQTGVALANARLHARERASAEELRAANVSLAETVAVLERATAIHERLTRAAAAGEGEGGIARAVHELTGHPVAAEDRHGNLRAWAGPGRPDPYPKDPPALRDELLRRARREGRPLRRDGRVLAIAGSRDDVLGLLVLEDPHAIAGEQELVALELGATVLAQELARARSLAETELRLGRDLVEELLTGVDEESALARARALGYDLERSHRVVVVASRRPRGDDGLLHAARRAAGATGIGSLLVARGGEVVLLADAAGDWEAFRAGVDERHDGGCRVGVGGPCAAPSDFPRSYREARFALRIQDGSDRRARTVRFDDLGVYRILAEVEETSRLEAFVREWLGSLIDYDADKKSELVTTLSRYLENGRSYDATAAALTIHRSTLKYRLRRIAEISGHDLSEPETLFNLQLAARAWNTLAGLRG